MKSPLWIVNSILVILLIAIITFIGFSLKKIVEPINVTQITPTKIKELTKEEKPKPKDIKYIYQGNDLFGTYKAITDNPQPVKVPEVPNPPTPKPLATPEEPQVQFLEPLPIKISGIISGSSESKSQVTVVNNKTKETKSYKVGDKLFDAYIIRIFPRKILALRSNGQQDSIYMYQEDAEQEIKELQDSSWTDVVHQISPETFEINKDNFIKRVSSLAQLIDMLDTTTAFEKGNSIGCRIGNMDKKSIGYSLGLLPGDVITLISDIEPTTTENRIKIYNIISQANQDDIIKIEIRRNKAKITLEYRIKTNTEINKENKEQTKIALNNKETRLIDTIKTAKRKNNMSSSIKEIKKRDKYAMTKYGGRESILKNLSH